MVPKQTTLVELDKQLTSVLDVFRSYKAFARREYLMRLGLGDAGIESALQSLIDAGYLKRNKAGAISETIASQRQRNNGLTNAERMDQYRREAAAQRQADWDHAFGGNR